MLDLQRDGHVLLREQRMAVSAQAETADYVQSVARMISNTRTVRDQARTEVDAADRDALLKHIAALNTKAAVTGTERFREPLWDLMQRRLITPQELQMMYGVLQGPRAPHSVGASCRAPGAFLI